MPGLSPNLPLQSAGEAKTTADWEELKLAAAVRQLVSRDAQRSAWSHSGIYAQGTPSAPLRVAANQEVMSAALLTSHRITRSRSAQILERHRATSPMSIDRSLPTAPVHRCFHRER